MSARQVLPNSLATDRWCSPARPHRQLVRTSAILRQRTFVVDGKMAALDFPEAFPKLTSVRKDSVFLKAQPA